MSAPELSPAAALQRGLWGDDPRGWAEHSEPHVEPLFRAVLDAVEARPGTRLLDVGCGTGGALVLATERGAACSGIDVTPGLIAIARERLPHADLREAEMEELPFADGSFDAVIGVNSFQFAGDPRRALAEAARVLRPGGLLAASLFAAPERSESTAVHLQMQALIAPEDRAEHAPYSLSAPGGLETALEAAGLQVVAGAEVVAPWHYLSLDDALRGLLSSAGAAAARRSAGADRVRATVTQALAPFAEEGTGAFHMRNTFRWVAARR